MKIRSTSHSKLFVEIHRCKIRMSIKKVKLSYRARTKHTEQWTVLLTLVVVILQHEVCVWSLFKSYTKEKYSDAHTGAVSCLKLTHDAKRVISGKMEDSMLIMSYSFCDFYFSLVRFWKILQYYYKKTFSCFIVSVVLAYVYIVLTWPFLSLIPI